MNARNFNQNLDIQTLRAFQRQELKLDFYFIIPFMCMLYEI